MKKVRKSLRKKYPIMRVYKSDLEKIFNLFKDHYPKIEIVADGFKLDDISELSKIDKQEIVEFSISAYDEKFFGNSISVDFSKDSTTVHLDDEDDIKARGLATQIGDILSNRKSYLRFFTNFGIGLPLYSVFLILILSFFKGSSTERGLLLLANILLFVVWLFLGLRLDMKKHSLIYLYDNSSASGFFKRKKDDILLSVISALIGALIGSSMTLGIQWLVKKI
jgi:hypothetical protein